MLECLATVELCVFCAWLRLRTFLISGDNMSTAFLCGYIEEGFHSRFDLVVFINTVKSIIEENDISKIYHCKRNFFDVKICEYVKLFGFDNVEIIELRDIHKKDNDYRLRQSGYAYIPFCPFEKEIENSKLYQTLYDYAIENSDILITYSKFDDDISQQIIKRMLEKGKKVFNIAEMM